MNIVFVQTKSRDRREQNTLSAHVCPDHFRAGDTPLPHMGVLKKVKVLSDYPNQLSHVLLYNKSALEVNRKIKNKLNNYEK